MRTASFLVTGLLLTGVTLVGGFGPTSASAAGSAGKAGHYATSSIQTDSPPSPPRYDIESYNSYCIGGGYSCIPASTTDEGCDNADVACPGYRFASADFNGPDTGATFGTPYFAWVECDNDTPSGEEYAYIFVVSPAGHAAYPEVDSYSDVGVITGKATLLNWAQFNPMSDPAYPEGNPSQTSSASVSVYDPVTHIRATVTGVQNTDNINDLPNSGEFRITLSGNITLEQYVSHDKSTYRGTISCVTGGPHATDIHAGTGSIAEGPLAEGELEDNPGAGD